MSHALEPAATGRSKCRACRTAIAKGTWRVGERVPNPFGDGEAVYWFHPGCAALKRPHVVLELVDDAAGSEPAAADVLEATWVGWARRSADVERLVRVGAAGRAPSGRARCRQCRELIAKDTWRVALDIWEDGRFAPLGFVHAGCAVAYCRVASAGDLGDRVLHRSELSAEEQAEVRGLVEAGAPAAEEPGA